MKDKHNSHQNAPDKQKIREEVSRKAIIVMVAVIVFIVGLSIGFYLYEVVN